MKSIPLKSVPFLILVGACAATLAVSQADPPTARAHDIPRVRVQWQKAERTPGGLIVTGRVTNVGSAPLTYTQVSPLLMDTQGRIVYRGTGYLLTGPLAPGQSANFRGWEADAPPYVRLQMTFRESGQPVAVDVQGQSLASR